MRVDGARETAFVMNGLDSNLISLRRGVSYWEAVEQLVTQVGVSIILPKLCGISDWLVCLSLYR